MVNRNIHNENFPVSDRYMRSKKRAIESLYCGKMTVYNKEEITVNHITEFTDRLVYEDIPCRICYQDSDPTSTNEPAKGEIDVRVILDNDIEIKDGSTVYITQHGKTGEYKRSGIPRHFSDHQTIPFTLIRYA